MKSSPPSQLRAASAWVLNAVVSEGRSLDDAMALASTKLPERDQSLFKHIGFGTCRDYRVLAAVASQLLRKPFKAKDAIVHALLLVGIYQLWRLRVPSHAAISETVEAARILDRPWAKGVLNGCLRRVQREPELLEKMVSTTDPLPAWINEKIARAWPDYAGEIVSATQAQAPMTLRVNRRCGTRETLAQAFMEAEFSTRDCRYAKDGFSLDTPQSPATLPGFAEGKFSVQDEAAQLAAEILDAQAGHRVLDACAAPGGKTCHIAEREPELVRLVALDSSDERLQRLRDNCSRLNLKAEICVGEAQHPEAWWDGNLFDRILLDAPCSATGVIRRHPDIPLLRRAQDVKRLARLQGQMLDALWPLLAPGGILLYATCSIFPEENEQQIAAFVARSPEALHCAIDAPWGQARPFGRQLFPQIDGHDGFYYARLRKAPSDPAAKRPNTP